MNRRAFLATVIGVPALGQTVAAAPSVHLQGTLTPTDSGNLEGYYALCAENGTCHPIDALGISVHPKSIFSDDLRGMANRRVQVSIFPVA